MNEPPTRGQPPKRGQKLYSQSVLYSEVPLYIQCTCEFPVARVDEKFTCSKASLSILASWEGEGTKVSEGG